MYYDIYNRKKHKNKGSWDKNESSYNSCRNRQNGDNSKGKLIPCGEENKYIRHIPDNYAGFVYDDNAC